MASDKCLIWDFDGTLGYRTGRWSGTLVQVLDRFAGRKIDIETVRPFMQRGFPWDSPDVANPPMRPPDAWWEAMLPVFAGAFVGCGVPAGEACRLAPNVRPVYLDLANWRLFEDTLEVLENLRPEGWRHAILSNHVPELRTLTDGLGLTPLIDCIVNSAETGFEKPNPRAFQAVLSVLDGPDDVWMIGDNIKADVLGAETAGLRAILVRSEDPRAKRRAASLRDVRQFLE